MVIKFDSTLQGYHLTIQTEAYPVDIVRSAPVERRHQEWLQDEAYCKSRYIKPLNYWRTDPLIFKVVQMFCILQDVETMALSLFLGSPIIVYCRLSIQLMNFNPSIFLWLNQKSSTNCYSQSIERSPRKRQNSPTKRFRSLKREDTNYRTWII